MPKIIQLCDGIMASGQQPTTHGMTSPNIFVISFHILLQILVLLKKKKSCKKKKQEKNNNKYLFYIFLV